jgi:hypothetical protein
MDSSQESMPRSQARNCYSAFRRSAPLIFRGDSRAPLFGEGEKEDGAPAPLNTGPAERWLFWNRDHAKIYERLPSMIRRLS